MEVLRSFPPPGAGVAAELLTVKTDQPAHGHAFMELVLVKSGSALHRTYRGVSHIGPGAVRTLRPGQWHAYDDPRDLVVWNLYISSRTFAGELTSLRADPLVASLVTGRLDGSGAEAAIGLVEPHLLALSLAPDGNAGDKLARLGHLLVVIGHLVPALVLVRPGDQARPVHPAVSAATHLLHAHPERRWTLSELARRVNISEHYLCRCFARELGVSPMGYLDRHRLEIVAQLLLETSLSITAISARVGISDPSYLARRFRALHGMTPSQYRSTLSRVMHAKTA